MYLFQNIKSRIQRLVFFLGLLILSISCQENEPAIRSDEPALLISSELFEEDFEGSLIILEADVSNEILFIKVGYSGCEESKDFTLVFSEQVFDTSPPTLDAKLIFEPVTLCAAFFTSDIQIDLSSLKNLISKPYRIRLDNWNQFLVVR